MKFTSSLKRIFLLVILIFCQRIFALDICDIWVTDPHNNALELVSKKICQNEKLRAQAQFQKYHRFNGCSALYCGDEAKALLIQAIKDGVITKKEFGDAELGKGKYKQEELNDELDDLQKDFHKFQIEEIQNKVEASQENLQQRLEERDDAYQKALEIKLKADEERRKLKQLASDNHLAYTELTEKVLKKKYLPDLEKERKVFIQNRKQYNDAKKQYDDANYQGRLAAENAKIRLLDKKEEVKKVLADMHQDSLLQIKKEAQKQCQMAPPISKESLSLCYAKNDNFKKFVDKEKSYYQRRSEQLKKLDRSMMDSTLLISLLLNGNNLREYSAIDNAMRNGKVDQKMDDLPLGDYIRRKAMEISCTIHRRQNLCPDEALLNEKAVNDTVRDFKNIQNFKELQQETQEGSGKAK